MTELLVAGALTQDRTRIAGSRWSQPGGAPWHAALALTRAGQGVAWVGQSGPWASAFALPALSALADGTAVRGPVDTAFFNDYTPQRRFQRLLRAAAPLRLGDLPAGEIAAVSVSPLYRDAIAPELVPALAERGAFVALDAQGLLRRVGPGGRIETESPPGLSERLAGARAVKFSLREFAAAFPGERGATAAGLARSAGVELLVTHGAGGAELFLPDGGAVDRRFDPSDREGPLDTTGAGDVFLAAYAHARAGGATPARALEAANAIAGTLIAQRRAAAAGRPRLLPALRRLQACALWAQRRVPSPPPPLDATLFAPHGRLATALRAHLPAVEHPSDSSAQRGPAQLSLCWALLTLGWPSDPALAPDALRALALEESRALSRVREALIA